MGALRKIEAKLYVEQSILTVSDRVVSVLSITGALDFGEIRYTITLYRNIASVKPITNVF